MDVSLLGIFQTIGAGMGMISAGFLIWDRAIRNRPFIRLKGRPVAADFGPNFLHADVVNPSTLPIIVRTRAKSGDLYAAVDDSIKSAVRHGFGYESSCLIEAGGSREFVVHTPRDLDQLPADRMLRLTFRWWPAQARWSKWPHGTASAYISKARLEIMLEPQHHTTG
jgi:hypothetical protein